MGFNNIILLSWLITSAVVIAQENKLGLGLSDVTYNSNFNLRIPPANISSIRNNILSFFNGFSHLPNLISPINTLRLKRSAEHQEQHSVKTHASHQTRSSTRSSAGAKKNNTNRLSVTTRITSCNYANHPGSRCLSCREAITCFRNNRAVVRRCYFILRYCNKGRCSYTPGNKCYRTSTTTTTTTTTTTSSTSSTTTSPVNTTSTTVTTSSSTTPATNVTSTTTTRSTSANTTSTTTVTPSSTTTSPSSSTATSSATSTTSSTTSASSTSTGSRTSTTNSSTT